MSFKNYLNEKSSQSQQDVFTLMADGYIPISTKMMERLGFLEDNFTAYHATTLKHLKGLSKIGKTKKGVSAFSKGLGSVINNIVIEPEVLAKITGDKLLGADQDFFTYIDKQGRRWFKVRGDKGMSIATALKSKVIKAIDKMLDLELDDYEFDLYVDGSGDEFTLKNLRKQLSGSQKNELIRMYYDNAEAVIDNSRYFKIIQQHLKDASYLKHDELVMNNFKVEGVWGLDGYRAIAVEDLKEQIEKMGYKYLGHIHKEDIKNFKY